MKILMAIDGSTKSSGVSIFNAETKELIHYECITAGSTEKLARIKKMVDRFEELYNEYNVDTIVMEEPLPDDVKNNQNVYKALMYLQAETAMRFYHNHKQPINDFIHVSSWRSACGIAVGRTGVRDTAKAQSVAFIKTKYKIDVNDDIADAICIGWYYINPGLKEPKQRLKPIGSDESAF